MNRKIQDVMTKNVKAVRHDTSVREVAYLMRDAEIGDVLVNDAQGKLLGIATDRDLVVRCIAESRDPDIATVGEICTRKIVELTPEASVDDAVRLMRECAIRRIPVVQNGATVGIVSIGDLAQIKDPDSALAEISAAPANN